MTRADDTGTVFAKLSLLGRDLLLETLPKIIAGTATRTPQDPDKVTFSPTITKEQEHLNIHLPAKALDQWIRALRPDVGGYVYLNGQGRSCGRLRRYQQDQRFLLAVLLNGISIVW